MASQGGGFATYENEQPEIFLRDRCRGPRGSPPVLSLSKGPEYSEARVRWNYLYDLPLGRGKKFAGNIGGGLDRLVGGWQIAGYGTTQSRYWQLPATNWGPISNSQSYGSKYKISDCRQGTCFPGYLYWNGYIPANRINNATGVNGVPQSAFEQEPPRGQPVHLTAPQTQAPVATPASPATKDTITPTRSGLRLRRGALTLSR